MQFQDRREAGQLLAIKLDKYKSQEAVVFALPRGGVVLGVEIAKHLHVPLDLVIPRKIGHPGYSEYAVCAITEGGHLICNSAEAAQLEPIWLQQAAASAQKEAKRRRQRYLSGRPAVEAGGKLAIIVDDGIATGLTMMAAIKDVKAKRPSKILLAIPVLPSNIAKDLAKMADEIVALDMPEFYLGSVGSYYREFAQIEDEEVIKLLDDLIAPKRKLSGKMRG